jgi:hypothetical protein
MIRKVLSVLSLFAASVAMPPPLLAADIPCADVRLLCSGFEPNWRFTLEGGTIAFIDPEGPHGLDNPLTLRACASPISASQTRVTAGAPLDLDAIVVAESCTQPNDEVWPFSVEATFNQGAPATIGRVSGTGCCRLP